MSKRLNDNPERFEQLVRDQRSNHPAITLSPEYAELFELNTLMVLIKLARYKFAARMLKKTDNVLEVGSGTGIGAQFLAQHCDFVTGLEIKEADHGDAVTSQRRKNVRFLLQSLFDYDLNARHDAVVCLDVIEHMGAEEGDAFVKRMAHHTKPDGMLIMGSPSIYSYPHQGKYSQASHVHCYDQQEMVDLVDRYYRRSLVFSMNDEIVHTGHPKMAWYYIAIGMMPRGGE